MASSKWSHFVEQLKHSAVPHPADGGEKDKVDKVGEPLRPDEKARASGSAHGEAGTPASGDCGNDVPCSASVTLNRGAREASNTAAMDRSDLGRRRLSLATGQFSEDSEVGGTKKERVPKRSVLEKVEAVIHAVAERGGSKTGELLPTEGRNATATEDAVMNPVGGRTSFFGGLISGRVRDDLALVIGGDRIFLASKNRPEVVAYQAVVAVARKDGEVVALGHEAETMKGQDPQNVATEKLLLNGVIRDPLQFSQFLKAGFRKHFRSRRHLQPRVYCAGNFPTPMAARAATEAVLEAGAKEVVLCDSEIAVARGMGIDIHRANLISVLLVEKDWTGFGLVNLGCMHMRMSTGDGYDEVLEDIGLHLQETQGFAPRESNLRAALSIDGFERKLVLEGWEAWGDQVEKGRPKIMEVSPETNREAVRHYLLKLKHRIHKALDGLDRDQRWFAQNVPLHFSGEFSKIPGFPRLLGDALQREVVPSLEGGWTTGHGLVELLSDKASLRRLREMAG